MKTIAVATIVASASAYLNNGAVKHTSFQPLRLSDSDMFGGERKVEAAVMPVAEEAVVKTRQSQKYEDQAAKLRQEAADLEVAMREEARAKGLPEEMINKLIPLPRQAVAKAEVVVEEVIPLIAATVRTKLGYLNTGDAVRFSSELERIKAKGSIRVWNVKEIGKTPNFAVSNGMLTSRSKIDPLKLKLDDVGYAYQNVFVAALAIGGGLGISSSFIGGQLGFILGYSSALIPITLVGLGSVAPSLIGDILARFKYATDDAARDQYIHCNAGKFLVGYVLGLPVSTFKSGSPSNEVEFFQLRPPPGKTGEEGKQVFRQEAFKQLDIARCSASCIAGNVAECIMFGQSNGKNPGDVTLLNEVISAVQPPMTPEATQSHIRWSALTAFDIITEYKAEYLRLVEAFREGLTLEECISVIEGTGEVKITN